MKKTDTSGKLHDHFSEKPFSFRINSVSVFASIVLGMLAPPLQAQGLTVNYNGEASLIQSDPLYTTGTHYAIYPGTPLQPGASGNTVNINADIPSTGLRVETVYGGVTAGDDDLTDNTVNVNGVDTGTAYIIGAESTGNGNVTNNRVVISGSTVSQATAGYAFTRNTVGAASYNTLVLRNRSTATGSIHGAVSRADDVTGIRLS